MEILQISKKDTMVLFNLKIYDSKILLCKDFVLPGNVTGRIVKAGPVNLKVSQKYFSKNHTYRLFIYLLTFLFFLLEQSFIFAGFPTIKVVMLNDKLLKT